MKPYALKVALAFVVLATCGKAVIIPDTAAKYAQNLQSAIVTANKVFSPERDVGGRGFGKIAEISPWKDDLAAYNNIARHFAINAKNIRYAHLGVDDDYLIHAIDWKWPFDVPKEDRHDGLYLFAMHEEDETYVPLGMVRYDHGGLPHNKEVFWEHTPQITPETMLLTPGFPPQEILPRRRMQN